LFEKTSHKKEKSYEMQKYRKRYSGSLFDRTSVAIGGMGRRRNVLGELPALYR
jgi:hypothetical protein